MNYKKLIIGITIVNLFAWGILEVWGRRYAGTNIEIGAGILVFLHIAGYYIICISSIKKAEKLLGGVIKPKTQNENNRNRNNEQKHPLKF